MAIPSCTTELGMGEEKEEIFVKYLILAISLLDMNE